MNIKGQDSFNNIVAGTGTINISGIANVKTNAQFNNDMNLNVEKTGTININGGDVSFNNGDMVEEFWNASVELKEGSLGFIGGMKIPSVQKFNWGFQQGIAYANANLGTNMTLDKENVIYQGTFNDVAAGTQLANAMYDRGVKAIFCAAGGVGNGVITAAKTQADAGKDVWMIGVDRDQYDDGIYSEGKSVVLTSAIKKVDSASYNMIEELLDGNFPGGQTLTFDISKDAVGIPAENPNLSDDTMKVVDDIYTKLKDGSITVKNNNDDGSLFE